MKLIRSFVLAALLCHRAAAETCPTESQIKQLQKEAAKVCHWISAAALAWSSTNLLCRGARRVYPFGFQEDCSDFGGMAGGFTLLVLPIYYEIGPNLIWA